METVVENIEPLERAILNEARAEADQIHSEAVAKADEILKRVQQQAGVERQTILERARQEAERLRSQVIATAQLKARTMQLEHREKLLDRVFSAAMEKLPEIRKRSDYDRIVAQLLREALNQLRVNEAQVRADEITQKVLKDAVLNKISKESKAQLTIEKSLEEGIGLIVDAADGHLHYDNTFETRLNRLQGTLRSSVYQVLMGERL